MTLMHKESLAREDESQARMGLKQAGLAATWNQRKRGRCQRQVSHVRTRASSMVVKGMWIITMKLPPRGARVRKHTRPEYRGFGGAECCRVTSNRGARVRKGGKRLKEAKLAAAWNAPWVIQTVEHASERALKLAAICDYVSDGQQAHTNSATGARVGKVFATPSHQ